MYFDEMSRLYFDKTVGMRNLHAPVTGNMRKENMPGYRAPKINFGPSAEDDNVPTPTVDVSIPSLLASISIGNSGGHELCLQVIPILTGYVQPHSAANMRHVTYHNHDVPVLAAEFISFTFAVYGFNSGHFTNRFSTGPLDVAIAADPRPCGRAMFAKFTKCPRLCDSADGMLHSIATSDATSVI